MSCPAGQHGNRASCSALGETVVIIELVSIEARGVTLKQDMTEIGSSASKPITYQMQLPRLEVGGGGCLDADKTPRHLPGQGPYTGIDPLLVL